MGVSINWLKQYIDFDWEPEILAHNLTMAGIAVEGITRTDNDTLVELDLTPNRGDCQGMINLAREVAALNGNQVKIPEVNLKENNEDIRDYINIEIAAPDLCKRYAARVVKNCKIKPSPAWMQEALLSAGVRPINNIVDITNYVLLETNQPLHAFDYELLGAEKKIVVRRAFKGENFVTLDEIERKLDEDMLVITDGKKPVALAGVMGGQNTEINNQTTAVLLESAYFTPGNIRKTSRKLGLRTESSIRFEKGLDINGIIYAVDRAAQLIQEMAEGEIVGGVFDVYPQPQEPVTIILRPERVNYLLGTELKPEEVKNYLSRLSFKSIEKDGQIVVEVPTYRPDIEMEADLIEEVARLFGYGNIPADLPFGYTCTGGLNPFQKFRDRVKNTVSHYMSEVINYSFINPTSFDLIQLPEGDPLRDAVKIANPLSEDQSIMRTTLLPGLLENISKNLARKNEGLSFFEMGSVFFPASALPLEKLQLAGIVCGSSESNWLKKGFEMDFFYLKGILENLFEELSVKDPLFVPVVNPSYHPGRCAGITCRGEQLGILGEIHPAVLSNYDIKQRVCALEIDVDLLYKYSHEKRMTQEIAKYPAVERDLAILVDGKIKASEVLAVVREAETDLLRKVVLFDLYTGEQIPEGLKSLALKITFQSAEKTLKEDEINNSLGKILENLKEKLGAAQR